MSVVSVCDDVITACSRCGLVLAGDATPAEVEEAATSGTNMVRGRLVSHGICEICRVKYFGIETGSASAASELSRAAVLEVVL